MKWWTHRVTTFAAVGAVTGNLFAAGLAAAASVLPDKIEYMVLPTRSLWSSWHRTWTHWLCGYAVALVALWWWMTTNDVPVLTVDEVVAGHVTAFEGLPNIVLWTLIGCVAHVLEDAPCGQVPVLIPGRKRSACPRLFTVGTLSECIFVTLVVIVSACTWCLR